MSLPARGGSREEEQDARSSTSSSRSGEPRIFRWVDNVSEVAGYLAGICILLAAGLICYSITARAFNSTAIWQLEASIYLLIVVTFLGASYGVKHKHHIAIDLFVNRLPPRVTAAVEVVVTLSVVALIVFVGLRGLEMTTHAYAEGHTSGTAWNVPIYLPYAALPLGMLLLTAQYLVETCRALRRVVSGERVLSEREEQLAPDTEAERLLTENERI